MYAIVLITSMSIAPIVLLLAFVLSVNRSSNMIESFSNSCSFNVLVKAKAYFSLSKLL